MDPTSSIINHWKLTGLDYSYNRYLAIAARVVRRSLKEQHRLASERRGDMELKMARWEVSSIEHIVGRNNCH